ncbi:uncharacterized protein LOC114527702 [Dendronephthya gigantea]|uniref:uncharacterized protein LOC114527702 n=1 Tax=Dendronephthya gigantea TaxID=151771 RepID=UPI00106D8A5C|nr:uncharacterized protein LOC114527702 [Dendronephthya gigantea]
MNPNVETDVPRNKKKQAIAMFCRSQQVLTKKLKNIDVECTKALSGIDRDLEKTRASLKAFRVNQLGPKSSSLDSQLSFHKQDLEHTPYPPRRRSQPHLAFGNDGPLKAFARRRSLVTNARPQEAVRRNIGINQGDKGGRKDMKMDKMSGQKMSDINHNLGEKDFNVEVKETDQAVSGSLPDDKRFEVNYEIETEVAMTQGNLDTKLAVFHGKIGSEMQEELGTNESQDQSSWPSNPGNEDKNDSEAWNEGRSPGDTLRDSWTNEDVELYETVDENRLLPTKASLAPEDSSSPIFRKRSERRRASLPNLIYSRSDTAPPKSMKMKIRRSPSLESIKEIFQENTRNFPSSRLALRPRRSSIAGITMISQPGFESSLNQSLPELNKTSPRGSSQDHHVQESLRKIGRRMSTAVTGQYLERRLLAHRGVKMPATTRSTTRESWPPPTRTPAPNELGMSDLEECRYLRRRTSK